MEAPNDLMPLALSTLLVKESRERNQASLTLRSNTVALQKKATNLILVKLPPLVREPPGRAVKPKLSVSGVAVFQRVDVDFILPPAVVL